MNDPIFMLTKARKPSIVAVIASLRDFDDISSISSRSFDLCELRIDKLLPSSDDLLRRVRELPFPKIATVRDPLEGGANSISESTRLSLFERWLPVCNFIDVELRNLSRFPKLIQEAESTGKEVIVSFHDFAKTPKLEELQEMFDRSGRVPNRIFKVATTVSHWSDVEILIHLIQDNPEFRVAAMGMGALGKLSRLALARLGSCLVYGSLGAAVVPGQWPVTRLSDLLSEIW
jgi:3-dehydroquinate dehydratase I